MLLVAVVVYVVNINDYQDNDVDYLEHSVVNKTDDCRFFFILDFSNILAVIFLKCLKILYAKIVILKQSILKTYQRLTSIEVQ